MEGGFEKCFTYEIQVLLLHLFVSCTGIPRIFHVKLAVDIYRVLYYNNFKKAKETNVYYREGELYEHTNDSNANIP